MNPKRIYRLLAKLMFIIILIKKNIFFLKLEIFKTIALFQQQQQQQPKIETYPKDHKLLIDK